MYSIEILQDRVCKNGKTQKRWWSAASAETVEEFALKCAYFRSRSVFGKLKKFEPVYADGQFVFNRRVRLGHGEMVMVENLIKELSAAKNI